MDLKFIPQERSALPKILDLFKNTAEKIAQKNIDHWQYWRNPPVDKVKWVKEGLENHEFFFIENNRGNRIGMVRILKEDLFYWGKQDDKSNYVHSLVVSEKYNGRGLGEKILKQIANRAKVNNCKYLRLDCDAKNPKLCAYYENQGFLKVGQRKLPLSTYNLYQKELD